MSLARWRQWLSGWRSRSLGRFGSGSSSLSLSRQLLWWVLLPQLVLWMAGGVAAYRFAASYANEAIDASLSQASRALARQLKPIGSGLLIDFPKAAQDVLDLTDMTAATAVLMIDGNAGDALDMSSFGLAVGAVNALNKLTSAKSISMDFNGNGTFDIGETATSDATGLITFNNGFRGNQTYQIWQAGSGNATFNGMILLIDSDVAFTGI